MSMAGGNNPKSSSSSHHKTRWESNASTAPATTTKSPSDSKPKPNPNNPNHNPNPNPSPKLPNDYAALIPFHFAEAGPPPPPIDGFHMLEQRIIHADGSVLSYFALLPDYQDFTPPPRPIGYLDTRFPPHLDGRHQDFRNQMEASAKRKFSDEDGRDEFARQREQLLSNANGFSRVPGGGEYSAGPSGPLKRDFTDPVEMRPSKHSRVDGVGCVYNAKYLPVDEDTGDPIEMRPSKPSWVDGVGCAYDAMYLPVDEDALEKAFIHFVKLINENPLQKNSYLENGKQGRLQCLVCGSRRSAKDFPDTHALIMHAYISGHSVLRVAHWGLHKALCVLMGWSYSKTPDDSKVYQIQPAYEAKAYRDNLIMWPPLVIIHNTNTGKSGDGRMEGLDTKSMDNKLRELGFVGGKSKSLYGKDGHLGITLVKFAGDESGLKEATRLAEHFKKENHGRKDWECVHPQTLGSDDENNPNLVKMDESKVEKRRISYGYMGTAFDLDKVDFDTRKKIVIKSRIKNLHL